MSADPETRVRAALGELGEALIELARASAPQVPDGPVELLSPRRFVELSGLGRSTVYLGIADGSIRSTLVRGRRIIPSSELARLAAAAVPAVTRGGRTA